MSLVLRVPRRLESPNASRGGHWRVRHRISMEWERDLGWARVTTKQAPENCLATGKMRVTVERHVPSGRNFIRDDDNLMFATKPVRDALKRLGYIKGDSRVWLEHPLPTQHVSEDGRDWTIVRIEKA
jgi:Holliday junction resolvase RusA-like endonuclease